MEGLDHIQLFAGAHELDGLAGGSADGECRTAAGIAVQLGEHHAVDAQRLIKGGGGVDGVLAGHGVHHQQNLVGVNGGFHALELVHERFVHMEPAGGIEKHHVVAVVTGVADGVFGNGNGIALALFKDRQIQLSAHHLELFDGGGTVHVAGGQQRPLAQLPAHEPGQLGGGGGFTGALQTHHHHNGGTVVGHGQLAAGAAHEVGQLLADDLDDLLGGSQAVQHVAAHGTLRDGGDELLDDLVAYVSLQQSQAHLAHSLPDVVFRQPALAPQALERGVQFFSQSFKCHGSFLQCGGLGLDALGKLAQMRVLVETVVDGLDLLSGGLDGVQMGPQRLEAPDEARLVLHLLHDALRPDDHVPDALTGDACVFRDLRKGQVLIIIEVEELLLPLGEKLPIKIV